MKVFIVVEIMEDGWNRSDSVVRGVYTDRQWANAKSYDIPHYEIEEWEVDEDDCNSN